MPNDLRDDFEREEDEHVRAIYANTEARAIVDKAFADAGLPPGDVYFALLERVDARLDDGTPRQRIWHRVGNDG